MRHPLVRTLFVALALAFGALAHAQSFSSVTDAMFDDLYADTFDCGELGFDERPYAFSRCGFINDNMVDVNKRIVVRHMEGIGLRETSPWSSTRDGNTRYHLIRFEAGSGPLYYSIIYTEINSNSSFVWVTAVR
jgi:hypothetical protein